MTTFYYTETEEGKFRALRKVNEHEAIVRDGNSINLNINVHTCGYAFCKECKKKLNEFAGEKLVDYERKLVEEFIKE